MTEASQPSSETCSLLTPKSTHDEAATIHLHPSTDPSSYLHARVHLESTSTLTLPSALSTNAEPTGTSFPQEVLHLVSRYKIHRLLIQIGDRSSDNSSFDNSNDHHNRQQQKRSMGPAGTYISASFHPTDSKLLDERSTTDEYKFKYTSLLRYLLDNSLFPACGAPLDSIRERKHGHSIIVHPQQHDSWKEQSSNIVQVEANLAADGSIFCSPNFILQSIWGGTSCHHSDNWGLLSSLFETPIDSNVVQKSSILSELLLGISADSLSGERHSMWIEVNTSMGCFESGGRPCIVQVNKGVSYRIGLPSSSLSVNNDTQRMQLTLGDLLLGRDTLVQSVAREGWKAWYPCPLSDSSKLILFLPSGYKVLIDGEEKSGRVEIDALASNEDYLDLAEPWAELYQVDESNLKSHAAESTFGIVRTVQRPFGIAGPGTLVTAVRVGEDASSAVRVESFDVLPGHLLKPKMQTMRMVLFQGGGAGGVNFVPFGGYDYDICATDNQCGFYNRTVLDPSDLQAYNLTRHTDGTIYMERTLDLAPDSSVWMMVDYDEAYLPFQKFPADANRGVDIFPSRATFTPMTPSAQPSTTLYSPSLLILPPVPDMSMPFNVISLSCTLWAFVLGSMINILVRRGTEAVKRELTGEKEKRPIEKLKDKLCEKGAKLKALFMKIKGAAGAEKTQESNGDVCQVVKEKKYN